MPLSMKRILPCDIMLCIYHAKVNLKFSSFSVCVDGVLTKLASF